MLPMVIALGENGFTDALRFVDLIAATYWSEDFCSQGERSASSPNFSPGRDVGAVVLFWIKPYTALVVGDCDVKTCGSARYPSGALPFVDCAENEDAQSALPKSPDVKLEAVLVVDSVACPRPIRV